MRFTKYKACVVDHIHSRKELASNEYHFNWGNLKINHEGTHKFVGKGDFQKQTKALMPTNKNLMKAEIIKKCGIVGVLRLEQAY